MNQYQAVVKCIESTLRNNKIFNQANLEKIVSEISYFSDNTYEVNYGDSLLKFSDNNNLYLYSVKENNDLLFFLNNCIYKSIKNINSLEIKWCKSDELDEIYKEDADNLSNYMCYYNYDCETMIEEECRLADEYDTLFEKLAESLDIEDLKIYIGGWPTDINNIKLTQFGLFEKVGDIVSTKEELLFNCKYFNTDTGFVVKILENIEDIKDIEENSDGFNYCCTRFYNNKLNIVFKLCANFDLETLGYGSYYIDDNILKKVSICSRSILNYEEFYEYAQRLKIEYAEVDLPF